MIGVLVGLVGLLTALVGAAPVGSQEVQVVPADLRLNLTAECVVGDTLYWRVTNDEAVDIPFTWDGPGTNDGSGLATANSRTYFTTQDAGGANTTIIGWDNPSGNTDSTTKAHNNQPCVYHVSFEKAWVGAGAPDLDGATILTATSDLGTATCTSDDGALSCAYPTGDDLHVPFGKTYTVTEIVPDGWAVVAGAGAGFTGIEGFDESALPDALVYDVAADRYCESDPDAAFPFNLEKFCDHTVVNEFAPPPALEIVKVVTGDVPDTWTARFGGDLGDFELTQDEPSSTFDRLPAGTYTVTEDGLYEDDEPVDSDLVGITCEDDTAVEPEADTDAASAATINLENGSVTVDLGPGDDVTCTFTNDIPEDDPPIVPEIPVIPTPEPASLEIVKVVTGDVPATWAAGFGGDLGAFELTDATPSLTVDDLDAGEVTVTETGPGDGAELVDVTCDADADVDLVAGSVTVDLAAGDDVSCTFTNDVAEVGGEEEEPTTTTTAPTTTTTTAAVGGTATGPATLPVTGAGTALAWLAAALVALGGGLLVTTRLRRS